MCLAIPGQVVEVYREHELAMAKVDFGGVARAICLECVPQAVVGDYVLVHVGFALALVDQAEARQVFEFLEQMQALDEVRDGQPPPEPEETKAGELGNSDKTSVTAGNPGRSSSPQPVLSGPLCPANGGGSP